MIYVAALILVVAYAAVLLLVLALCRVAAEGDRQTVYEPPAAVRSGEGGHAERKDAPHGCGPRERPNASSVASRGYDLRNAKPVCHAGSAGTSGDHGTTAGQTSSVPA